MAFIIITIIANRRGLSDAAAVGIVEKIISFVFLVPSSMLSTVSALCAQNIGAGKTDRVKRGIFTAWLMCSIIIFGGSILMNREGGFLVQLFTDDAEVIANGAAILKLFSYGYMTLPVVQILSGALRGAGKSSVPMFFMLGCFVVVRQIYLAITVPNTHSLLVVIAGWPLTWVLCAVGMAVYFFRVDWMKGAEKLVQGH